MEHDPNSTAGGNSRHCLSHCIIVNIYNIQYTMIVNIQFLLYSSFYHLCVIDYGLSSQVTIPGNAGGKRQKRSSEGGETYVTAELKSDELPRIVLVGDGSKIGGYVNKKLIGGHSYRLFVRAYVRQGSKYLNTTSSLTQPVTLPFLATPPVPKKNEQKAATTDGKSSGSNGVLIAAAVIGTLFVLLIVASIICIVR